MLLQAATETRRRQRAETAAWYAEGHARHDGCACPDCRTAKGAAKRPFDDWQPSRSDTQTEGEVKLLRELARSLRTLKERTWELVTGRRRKAEGDPVEWGPMDDYALGQATRQYLTETIGAPNPDYELWVSSPEAILPENLSLQFGVGIANGADLVGQGERLLFNARARQQEQFLRLAFDRLSQRGWGALKDVMDRGAAEDVDRWLADRANVQPPGVRQILSHGLANGRNSLAVGRDISRAYDEYERWEFERLARTETAFALNAGAQAELEAQGFVRVPETPDIPRHPSCRCSWSVDPESGYIIYSVSALACEVCRELLVTEALQRQEAGRPAETA